MYVSLTLTCLCESSCLSLYLFVSFYLSVVLSIVLSVCHMPVLTSPCLAFVGPISYHNMYFLHIFFSLQEPHHSSSLRGSLFQPYDTNLKCLVNSVALLPPTQFNANLGAGCFCKENYIIILISRNLIEYCCKCCILIGYATRYLFVVR